MRPTQSIFVAQNKLSSVAFAEFQRRLFLVS